MPPKPTIEGITKLKEYQDLSKDEQRNVLAGYFSEQIAPMKEFGDLDHEDKLNVFTGFMSENQPAEVGDLGREFAASLDQVGQLFGRGMDVIGLNDIVQGQPGRTQISKLASRGLKAAGFDEASQKLDANIQGRENADVLGVNKIGPAIEDHYKEREKEKRSEMSFGYQQEQQKTMLKRDDEGGLVINEDGKLGIGEGVTSPYKMLGMSVGSLPSMALGMGVGSAATSMISRAFPQMSPYIAGILGSAAGEGSIGGSFAAKNIYDAIIEAPEEKITTTKEYKNAINETGDHDLAVKQMARDAALKSFIVNGLATGVLGSPAGAAYGKLLKEGTEKTLLATMFKQGGLEVLQDVPQSGFGQYFENILKKQNIDPNQDLSEGVAEAMASGVIPSFGMGSLLGARARRPSAGGMNAQQTLDGIIMRGDKNGDQQGQGQEQQIEPLNLSNEEKTDLLNRLRVDLASDNVSIENAEDMINKHSFEFEPEFLSAANQIIGEAYGNKLELEINRQRSKAGMNKSVQKDAEPQFGFQQTREEMQKRIIAEEAKINAEEEIKAQKQLQKSQLIQQKTAPLVDVIKNSNSDFDVITAGKQIEDLKQQLAREKAVEDGRIKKEKERKFRFAVTGKTRAERRVEAQRKLKEADRHGLTINPELRMELMETANPGSTIEWKKSGSWAEPQIPQVPQQAQQQQEQLQQTPDQQKQLQQVPDQPISAQEVPVQPVAAQQQTAQQPTVQPEPLPATNTRQEVVGPNPAVKRATTPVEPTGSGAVDRDQPQQEISTGAQVRYKSGKYNVEEIEDGRVIISSKRGERVVPLSDLSLWENAKTEGYTKGSAIGTAWTGNQWKPIISKEVITRKGKNQGKVKVTFSGGKMAVLNPGEVRIQGEIEAPKTISAKNTLETSLRNTAEKIIGRTPPAIDRRGTKRESTERRKDVQARKRVGDMSVGELQKALLTDDLTGLGNRRAFQEADEKKTKASIDVDSLKWVNDNLGHQAGDQLLKAVGKALRKSGIEAYHPSGDEFWMQSDSDSDIETAMRIAEDYLSKNPLKFKDPSGGTIKFTPGFSYGKGASMGDADAKLQVAKEAREKAGLRSSRGEKPPGAVILEKLKSQTGSSEMAKDIYNAALGIYESGARTIKTFSKKLQEQFADAWDSIKNIIDKLFYAAKRALLNQSGKVEVWHGSPHKFDTFSSKNIGTGEGAQAFGHGLYFTSERGIAEHYAGKLGKDVLDIVSETNPVDQHGLKYSDVIKNVVAMHKPTDKGELLQAIDDMRFQEWFSDKEANSLIDWAQKAKIDIGSDKNIYKVTLFPNRSNEVWLDWDKPYSKDIGEKIARQLEIEKPREWWQWAGNFRRGATNGNSAYKDLAQKFGSEKEASLFLKRAGIDGIRYPVGTLSGGGKGTNYVVFDESAVTIDEVSSILKSQVGSSQLITDISVHAYDLIQSGIGNFFDFTQAMKRKFGKVWDKIRPSMKKIFDLTVGAVNNNRGGFEIAGRKNDIGKTPGKTPEKNQSQGPKTDKADELFKRYFGKTLQEAKAARPAAARVTPSGTKVERVEGLNLARMNISEDAKNIAAASVGKRQTITQAETIEGAKRNLSNRKIKAIEKKLKNLSGGKLSEEMTAYRVYAATSPELKAIMMKDIERLENGEIDSVQLIEKTVMDLQDSPIQIAQNMGSELGRAFNAQKISVGPEFVIEAYKNISNLDKRKQDIIVNGLKRFIEGKLTQRDIKEIKENLDDPSQFDYVIEYWYNSVLSGIPTHIVNISSNTLWAAFQIPHKMLLAGVDKAVTSFTGKERSHFMNEILPMLAGYKTGFIKGKRLAGQIMKTGKISEFEDKWSREMGHVVSAFERSPNETIRKLAPYLTMPTRALRAMDVWGNSIAFDGALQSMAQVEANKSGLQGQDLINKKNEVLGKWASDMPENVLEEASKRAHYSTFTDAPDPFTAGIISLRNTPGLGIIKLFVPFVNTISNLSKRGIEMTPGLGLVKEYASRSMGRGQSWEQVAAKQIEGMILSVTILSLAAAGKITGAAPEDKEEREQWYREGKQPWSIKMGDTWLSYRRIEPFNTVIAMAYSAHKNIINAPDEDTASEMFLNFTNEVKWNILDGSYFASLQPFFDKYDKSAGMAPRLAASFVPYSSFFRSINKSLEVAFHGGARPREGVAVDVGGGFAIPKEWTQAFSQVIPGLSGQMPAKLTLWGEEAIVPGGVFRQWLPYKWSEQIDDPIEKALEKMNLYPGLPGNSIQIGNKKYKLSDEDYRDYVTDFGRTLKERFGKIISQSRWDKIDPRIQEKMLRKIRIQVGDQIRTKIKNYILRKRITPAETKEK